MRVKFNLLYSPATMECRRQLFLTVFSFPFNYLLLSSLDDGRLDMIFQNQSQHSFPFRLFVYMFKIKLEFRD